MKDKPLKDNFYNTSDQELRFTKEDRNKVFQKIHNPEQKDYTKKKSLISFSKKFAPLTVSLLVVGLCIFLFIPSTLQGNITNEIKENNVGNASESIFKEDELFMTTLLTVKDDNNRIPINLLLTYSKEKNMMKVLSIPRDTYAPILDQESTTPYEKLSHAYVNGSGGAEDVRTAVSDLFDLTIDYYAVIDLETLSEMVGSISGIEYELQEDIRVRAISTVAFELKKGTNRLNGEEVVALLMDATVGGSLNEEDQLNLINAVINQTTNGLTETQFKQFTTEIESNFPIEQLFEKEKELPSIQLVSLKDGMIGSKIDEAYYIKFEQDFLTSITDELSTFE